MINAFLKDVEKHVIAESTNLGGTHYASHIVNVIASEDIDNGKLVNLTDAKYVTDNKNKFAKTSYTVEGDNYAVGECFTMVAPTATSRVGLIISVPCGYDERPYQATLESNFYNGKGEVMRVYELIYNDRFTVSANGITALGDKPVVGNYVTCDEYDIVEVAPGEDGAMPSNAFVGQIIAEIKRSGGLFYKILVLKNENN